MKFAIIASRFNSIIVDALVKGAHETLLAAGSCDVFWVPGALELPIAAQKAANTGRYGALVALGAVVKGSTDHYEHVSQQVHHGITRVSLDTKTPITMGVLTVETMAQALERAGGTHGNIGTNAAQAAIDTLKTLAQIGERS